MLTLLYCVYKLDVHRCLMEEKMDALCNEYASLRNYLAKCVDKIQTQGSPKPNENGKNDKYGKYRNNDGLLTLPKKRE